MRRLGQPKEQHNERETRHQIDPRRHLHVQITSSDISNHDPERATAGDQRHKRAPDLGQRNLADVEREWAVGHAETESSAEARDVEPSGAACQHYEDPAGGDREEGQQHRALTAQVVDRHGAQEGASETTEVQ